MIKKLLLIFYFFGTCLIEAASAQALIGRGPFAVTGCSLKLKPIPIECFSREKHNSPDVSLIERGSFVIGKIVAHGNNALSNYVVFSNDDVVLLLKKAQTEFVRSNGVSYVTVKWFKCVIPPDYSLMIEPTDNFFVLSIKKIKK